MYIVLTFTSEIKITNNYPVTFLPTPHCLDSKVSTLKIKTETKKTYLDSRENLDRSQK